MLDCRKTGLDLIIEKLNYFTEYVFSFCCGVLMSVELHQMKKRQNIPTQFLCITDFAAQYCKLSEKSFDFHETCSIL